MYNKKKKNQHKNTHTKKTQHKNTHTKTHLMPDPGQQQLIIRIILCLVIEENAT